MIRKSLIVFCLFPLLLLTTGCWDSRAITDKSLINGISFDLDQDKKIEISALILDIIGKGAGVFDFQNESVNSIKDSVSQAGMNIQSFLPGDITTSKTRMILLGEDFSKTEFIHLLSTFRRRPFSNLNVPVAITNKQPAKKVLELKTVGSKPLSFILRDTIDHSVTNSIIQKMELYNIFTYSSEKVDFTLPIIDITPKDRVEVIGAGLLHNGSYTGHFIPSEQSPLLLIMMGKYGNTGNFITKLPKKYKEPYNTISYEIIRPTRKLKVSTTKNKINANITLKVKVRINEMTTTKMLDEDLFSVLIRNDLNKRVKNVIDEIQLANSDVLGIGQYIREHKPDEWKKLNWEKEYPTIKIKPKVNVAILSTGTIGKESQIEE